MIEKKKTNEIRFGENGTWTILTVFADSFGGFSIRLSDTVVVAKRYSVTTYS